MIPSLIPAVTRQRVVVVAAQETQWPKCVKKGLFVHLLEMERVNADQQQPLVGDLA